MLKIWVVGVEQLKLDLVIETLEKHIMFLLISVDVIGGTPLVQIWKLILELEGAAGHIVSSEMNLELIPANCLDIEVGVLVGLPLVCCGSE
jgi:hypothetical protein